MANPRLRILLVDEEHSRRMNIEKNLAGLGYCRIAPLASIRELLVILENALCSFELLVINESMLSSAGPILEHTLRSCPGVKNLLVYQSGDLQMSSIPNSPVSSMSFLLSFPPGRESLQQVMYFVDDAKGRKDHEKKWLPVKL
ncbi:hypothetical protein QF019_006273 [Pseudomonas frederiksbergensis]|uniref:histidine kinase n=1 Tax=Pseudomonas frederiksbergensis TaxID=104087 RepID=UPI003D206CCD